MRVSDVISNVTKQNKTWTSWRQGTKLRVRLSLANARFASRIESDVYNKKKIQMFVVNMTFISSREVKKCIFHECLRHSWNIHFFTSLDEIKVIFTPNIWISSMSVRLWFHMWHLFCHYLCTIFLLVARKGCVLSLLIVFAFQDLTARPRNLHFAISPRILNNH